MEPFTKDTPNPTADRDFVPRATRYEPLQSDSYLSWRDSNPGGAANRADEAHAGQSEGRPHFALLLDISQTGAAIALDRAPQPGDDVWLKIGSESRDQWNQAEVVGVTTTAHGPHLVRLAFNAPCAIETLLATICG